MSNYEHTYIFPILAFENYDGDSFNLTLDVGFNLVTHRACRLHGVDTPELRGGTPESKAAGMLAKTVAHVWVAEAIEAEGALFKSTTYTGKFGRPLGDIIRKADSASLVEMLINDRLGVRYNGEAKRYIQAQHDANLQFLLSTKILNMEDWT